MLFFIRACVLIVPCVLAGCALSCPSQSIYTRVMENAIAKGVIMIKAAGNSGADGPFRADVATAVGAIAVASVDGTKKPAHMSAFSSFGPVSALNRWGRGLML